MQLPQISPEQVSISHSFALIIQLFEAFDGNPPESISGGIDEVFQEVCKLEGAGNDGSMQLWSKMMYCAHFIEQEEGKTGRKDLSEVLKKIQSVIPTQETDPLLYEFLGVNKMFVSAILSKTL